MEIAYRIASLPPSSKAVSITRGGLDCLSLQPGRGSRYEQSRDR